ncbi:hypothetical protein N0V86_003346 [Didymella sp. IMI 355093]|nr:hypothetical protein N0V86_003346 [Didymella sp. IMI 355093]
MNTPTPADDLAQLSLTDKESRTNVPTGTTITMDEPEQVAPLLRLSPELHLQIIAHLEEVDFMSVYKLRLSTKYFYNTISAPDPVHLLMLEDMQFSLEKSLYACKYCLRLRPASKFAEKMLRGKTGRYGDHPCNRFCADCGFDTRKPQRYMRGTQQKVNGELWVRRIHCDEVKKGIEVGETACKEACKRCHDRYGCRWLQAPKRCESKKPQTIEVYDPFYIGFDCMDWRDLDL